MSDERAQKITDADQENSSEFPDPKLVTPEERANAIRDQAPPVRPLKGQVLDMRKVTQEEKDQAIRDQAPPVRGQRETNPSVESQPSVEAGQEVAAEEESIPEISIGEILNDFDQYADQLVEAAKKESGQVEQEIDSSVARIEGLAKDVSGAEQDVAKAKGLLDGLKAQVNRLGEFAAGLFAKMKDQARERFAPAEPKPEVSTEPNLDTLPVVEVEFTADITDFDLEFGPIIESYATSAQLRFSSFSYAPDLMVRRFEGKESAEGSEPTIVDYIKHLEPRVAEFRQWMDQIKTNWEEKERKKALARRAEGKSREPRKLNPVVEQTEPLILSLEVMIRHVNNIVEKLASETDPGKREELAETLKSFEKALKKDEAAMDMHFIQRNTVPDFLRSATPQELHEVLKEGFEHPRFLLETILDQYDALHGKGKALVSPVDVLARSVPVHVQDGYKYLLSKNIPPEQRKQAVRIANQIKNRFFIPAADTLQSLPYLAENPELSGLIESLREADQGEKKRYEQLRTSQEKMYEVMLQDPEFAERKEAIEARRLTEQVFAEGEMVGGLHSIMPDKDGNPLPYDGKGPAVATFKLGTEVRTGVIKCEFADRYTRSGVNPGTGPMREVATTMAYVGVGVEVPAVVARDLEGVGMSSVTELVPGTATSVVKDFFKTAEGNLHPDLGLIAAMDEIVHRADGMPRNLMLRADGRLTPIDFGSDIPANIYEKKSSVASFVMGSLAERVRPEVQAAVKKWVDSPLRDLFIGALSNFPEDMSAQQEEIRKRSDAFVMESLAAGPDQFYPAYDPTSWMDFHGRFEADFDAFKKGYVAEKPPATTMEKGTVVR